MVSDKKNGEALNNDYWKSYITLICYIVVIDHRSYAHSRNCYSYGESHNYKNIYRRISWWRS